MASTPGLRERKKARTRQHIADIAAMLFAARGYDEVSVADIAAAAEVSDQTVYNYFPLKQDFVLDRAEEFRERLRRAIADRPAGTSPAQALHALARIDIDRHRTAVSEESRGQFPALYAGSPTIRRAGVEMFDQQAEVAAETIGATDPSIHPALARAHAAALVSVFQLITERTGRGTLDGNPPAAVADELVLAIGVVLDDLDRHFRHIVTAAAIDSSGAP